MSTTQYTFIRSLKTGSYIARCAHYIPSGTHVLYANQDGELRDGTTHSVIAFTHEEYNGLPVFTRDQNGIYR